MSGPKAPKWMVLNLTADKKGWLALSELIEGQALNKTEKLSLLLVAEEIFTNIIKYAYEGQGGPVRVRWQESQKIIQFRDQGKPYNPLKSPEPDIVGTAKERKIGGLGLYLVKKMVAGMSYRRRCRQNILTVKLK